MEPLGFVGVDDKGLLCSDWNFDRFAAGKQEIQRPGARDARFAKRHVGLLEFISDQVVQ